eukprot:1173315-Amphidinium_carterae.1
MAEMYLRNFVLRKMGSEARGFSACSPTSACPSAMFDFGGDGRSEWHSSKPAKIPLLVSGPQVPCAR